MDWHELIYRGVESDVLDYKAAVDWNLMTRGQKAKFVRHALAFANTKGGCIVVGVGEDASGHPSLFTGLDDKQSHSFDPSVVGGFINRYVDPAIDLTVERPDVDGKRYVVLVIRPFRDIPHVCTTGLEDELQQGVFYIRSVSAASRPASRAGELHELIRRALRNQRELLGRMIRGILFESQSQAPAGAEKSAGDIWPPEYEESVHYFAQRIGKGVPANAPIIDFAAFPITVGPAVWPLAELRRAALAAMEDTPEMPHDFIGAAEIAASYATNASLRGMDQTRDRFWQLFQNGLLHFRVVLERGIYEEELVSLINGGLNFTALFYSELGLAEETIRMEMNVSNTQDVEMHTARSGPAPHFVCRIPAVKIRQKVSAATLLSARRDCADQFLNELAVRFNAPVQPRSVPNS